MPAAGRGGHGDDPGPGDRPDPDEARLAEAVDDLFTVERLLELSDEHLALLGLTRDDLLSRPPGSGTDAPHEESPGRRAPDVLSGRIGDAGRAPGAGREPDAGRKPGTGREPGAGQGRQGRGQEPDRGDGREGGPARSAPRRWGLLAVGRGLLLAGCGTAVLGAVTGTGMSSAARVVAVAAVILSAVLLVVSAAPAGWAGWGSRFPSTSPSASAPPSPGAHRDPSRTARLVRSAVPTPPTLPPLLLTLALAVPALLLALALAVPPTVQTAQGRARAGDAVLVALGAALTCCGLLLRLPASGGRGTPRPPLRHRGPHPVLSAGLTLGVVVAAVPPAVTAHGWALAVRPDAATAVPGAPAPVPRTVSAVVWQAPLPDRSALLGSGSRGPMVELDDGVLALDGATGRELWHLRWRGRGTVDAVLSAGGRWVVVQSPPADAAGAGRGDRLVIDTATGRVVTRRRADPALLRLATGRYLVGVVPGSGAARDRVVVQPLPELDRSWSVPLDGDCDLGTLAAAGETLLVTRFCERPGLPWGYRVSGVDAATGTVTWDLPMDRPPLSAALDGPPSRFDESVEPAPDGLSALVRLTPAENGGQAAGSGAHGLGVLLRIADGEIIRDLGPALADRAVLTGGGAWVESRGGGDPLLHESSGRVRTVDWEDYWAARRGTDLPGGGRVWVDTSGDGDGGTGRVQVTGPDPAWVDLPEVSGRHPSAPLSLLRPVVGPGAVVVGYGRTDLPSTAVPADDVPGPSLLIGLR